MKQFYRAYTIIFLAFLTCFQAQAHEHSTLKGTVTDSLSGQRISNVSILLNGSQQGTSTDAFGNFKLTKITPGAYLVTISSLGFSSQTATVLLKDGEIKTLDFQL